MAKTSTEEFAAGSRRTLLKGGAKGNAVLAKREGSATGQLQLNRARFEAIMRAADETGLLSKKSVRIAGRVSPALIRQAKRQTGITADTELIEFALATIALEDNFAEASRRSQGKIDRVPSFGRLLIAPPVAMDDLSARNRAKPRKTRS
jgi:hypothetical protein